MLLTRPSLTLFLLSLTCSFISVSATLETGTWHCPSHIHINHYSNTTSTTTTSSTNQAPPPCNDTSTSPIITNPKPKPARDYKPACCDYLAPFKDVNGEFAAQGCKFSLCFSVLQLVELGNERRRERCW
jgi:hypothetical protein